MTMLAPPTVTASTMIARFGMGHKVRCHKRAVDRSVAVNCALEWMEKPW